MKRIFSIFAVAGLVGAAACITEEEAVVEETQPAVVDPAPEAVVVPADPVVVDPAMTGTAGGMMMDTTMRQP